MRRALLVSVILYVAVTASGVVLHLPASAEECSPLQVYAPVGGEPEVYIQDMNGDGGFDAITEAVYLLQWFFAGGPAPVRPCTSSSSGAGLPATGQTTCYDQDGNVIDCTSDTCAGQDGFYQTGCPTEGRFVDNEDGTVTDTCTGLMWQKASSPSDYSWGEALQYCESLELAGHTDWRLPNIRELQSVLDYGMHVPAIDPVFENLSSWSSSSDASSPDDAWFVESNGYRQSEKGSRNYVHAVRFASAEECAPLQVYSPVGSEPDVYIQDMNGDGGFDAITEAVYLLQWFFAGGPAPVRPCTSSSSGAGLPATGQTTCYDQDGNVIDCTSDTYAGQDGFYQSGCPTEGRFVDNEDGTVTDNCTGLMWQKHWETYSWCEALQYCESLELAGHTDWRLPNIRELQSIVDYGRHTPAIDPVFEDGSWWYWSSSSFARATVWAHCVHTRQGVDTVNQKTNISGVRAVRSGP